ncbi:MAG: hypothetical protein JXQ67_01975 [Campylobacterales bacterium]|nr:hypothetical protein [Campylobacterales bacterium]
MQECVKTRSSITDITVLNDGNLAFCTEFHGAKLLNTQECRLSKNLSIEHLGHKTTAKAFSKEHKLLAFANDTTIYIINLQNKTLLQCIKTNDGSIEVLSFVPNSPYLIAGTKDGRVTQFRYDGKSQLSRLCSFPAKRESSYRIKNNYVSALAFHGNYMAASGYGGTVVVMKMNSLADKRVIEASNLRVTALLFLDKETIVSGSKDGIVRIHKLYGDEKPQTVNTPFTDIKKIVLMPNENFLLVQGDSKKLLLINLHTAKVASNSYLSFKDSISDITLSDRGMLFIALENRVLYKFEFPKVEELTNALLEDKIEDAFILVDQDPMLQGTREHKRLEVLYEKLYTQAINSLIHSQKNEAYSLMERFLKVTSKKDEVAAIFKDFENYPRFKLLVAQKKFPLAYVMSEKFPALQRTLQFKKMEETFKDAFTFAQKQILIGRRDIAEDILLPYAAVVSKKTIINLLLKENRDFLEFIKAINEKNYFLIERLLKKNEHFAQIPNYITLRSSQKNSLNNIAQLINQSKLTEALNAIKELQDTPAIQAELKEFYRVIKLVEKLKESYEARDFTHCYELIDEHYKLNEIGLSVLLERHWAKLMQECESFALKGDIKSIKERLGVLIGIKTRVGKVGDLLRVSFHSKIKILLAKRSFVSAENIIYSYIDIFGSDSEIRSLMRIYEKLTNKKLAFSHEQERVLPRDAWIHSPLIMTPSNLQ